MEDRLSSLSEEKKNAVVNAALEVFGTNEYKRASTDLIAAKAGISKGLPFLMEFSVRAFFTSREDVSEDMNSFMKNQMDTMFVDYFKNVDMTKFREDIDPKEILNMLLWLTDGYLHQRMFYTDTVDADELMRQFRKWSEMLKRIAYKEEYLTEMVGRRQKNERD